MTAGKLGVDMLNVMQYSYDFPKQVMFTSLEGDVMKKLDGRYIFEAVPEEPSKTVVTYELTVDFGFPLPVMVRNQICGAIMRTVCSIFCVCTCHNPTMRAVPWGLPCGPTNFDVMTLL